ncbi:hypothetical protein ACFYY8_11480 [Streptosporangium sp. NPDC001559]
MDLAPARRVTGGGTVRQAGDRGIPETPVTGLPYVTPEARHQGRGPSLSK